MNIILYLDALFMSSNLKNYMSKFMKYLFNIFHWNIFLLISQKSTPTAQNEKKGIQTKCLIL